MIGSDRYVRGSVAGSFLGAAFMFFLMCGYLHAEESCKKEHDIKAAFLLNFIRFTYWPESGEDNSTLIHIFVFADDKTFASFEGLGEYRVRDRALDVRRCGCFSPADDMPVPEVIFVSRKNGRCIRDVIKTYAGHHVLTVSDIPGFLEQGGIIEFEKKAHTIHFSINLKAADAAGVKMNYQLLRLADKVVR